ncbi:MAG TPA: methyl-accepting chemotaxis protein [Xanthobacteraceae bacterium]
MFRRVSVNFLLQSVIAVVGVALVAVLAVGAWGAWSEVATASRLERIADVEGQAFRVLHNLRLDRSFTVRVLEHDGTPDPVQMRQVTQSRAAELPALAAALAGLRQIDMPNGDAAAGELDAAAQKFTTLAKESDADFTKPKSERRAGLPKEFETAATDLLGVLDRISDALVGLAKYQDPFVDQMMAMRDAAWIVRENGGDASVIVSTALMTKQKVAGPQWQREVDLIGRTEAGWAMVQKLRNGAALPPALTAAIDKAQNGFFGADFLAKRDEMVAMLAAGQIPSISVNDWTSQTVPRLGTVTDLAEAALTAAKQHAGEQLSAARGTLITKLAMLLGAALFAGLGFVFVSGRVIRPLKRIQTAMMQVANGDLAVEVPHSDREDEIGALAKALTTFKRNADEKMRIEAEQSSRSDQAVARQKAVDAHIAAFERHVGDALEALGAASDDMRKTSDKLSASAAETNRQAKDAAGAASNASGNVQTVAAASQELTASIAEISRQVTHAAGIAGRAVAETQETDVTVQGLADAAQRIGQVVNLINEIAEQTNLLALNATIEAARAGTAGRGFAVVASEVKSLATQTAKATGDISGQVAAIQEVADKAAQAMRRIGGTIGEVNAVATSIASAVEEQGAATQEITRNTQEAARRTGEVDSNITGLTAGADATGVAAANVRTSAEALGRQADALRHEVGDFLAKIRAA